MDIMKTIWKEYIVYLFTLFLIICIIEDIYGLIILGCMISSLTIMMMKFGRYRAVDMANRIEEYLVKEGIYEK